MGGPAKVNGQPITIGMGCSNGCLFSDESRPSHFVVASHLFPVGVSDSHGLSVDSFTESIDARATPGSTAEVWSTAEKGTIPASRWLLALSGVWIWIVVSIYVWMPVAGWSCMRVHACIKGVMGECPVLKRNWIMKFTCLPPPDGPDGINMNKVDP